MLSGFTLGKQKGGTKAKTKLKVVFFLRSPPLQAFSLPLSSTL